MVLFFKEKADLLNISYLLSKYIFIFNRSQQKHPLGTDRAGLSQPSYETPVAI